MPFLELALTVDAAQQESAEAALADLGALAVTLADADAETPDERAIFEPGVGETPLWAQVRMLALFEAGADRRGLTAALAELLPELEPDHLEFRAVADQDWERAWMDRYQPMRFGRRLWIYPWNVEPAGLDDDAVVVRLDPGLAFGTGTHPTTALCLEWLEGLDLAGTSLLDYGCGSGVLAIAALKLGAEQATGVDNDPQALAASADNATRNGVAAQLALHAPATLPPVVADVLVANILAGPLAGLAPTFAARLRPGAAFALSGILAGQESELLARYAECGFVDLTVSAREGWVRIEGRRG
ncbi:MAG: 50S ribosomal protein L11 methyltransferase [Xanthomonadaceae bacterium]|nr:50S ribosomal protein L11 methyltransferase [Xanthomonadaceae bacterium]MDE2245456.1 50S ribosomal protein L11 methyltransferase [Xanthomonadaceae bacterium]